VAAQALSRIRLAAAVAIGSALAIAMLLAVSPARGGPAALAPDLVTLAIEQEQLIVTQEGSRTLLRLSNEVGNEGNGPLEVFAGPVSPDCDGDGDPANDRDASQRIFADTDGSGGFEPGADEVLSERAFGCMRYHPAHDHWHVLDFARYELRREPSGKLAAASRKVGYCLVDNRQAIGGPFSPSSPRYPFGSGSDVGCDESATQGLSSGWADSYTFALPGQQLEVTGLRRGHYCLISEADPLDLLSELDEDDNARRVRLSLRPRRLSVRKLDGDCRI
jgi:hypothetical protein